MSQLHFRSIWISDVHLGTKNLQSKKLLDFLQKTESEYLYLVGDILDLLQAQKNWHWPAINTRIVQAVFDKAANGTKVYYIPGNHDHVLRQFSGNTINNIQIENNVIHTTVNGGKYLVMHGDKFDPVIQKSPWLASIGSSSYAMLLVVNRWLNVGRRMMGKDYRSISAWMKHQVKIVVNYMGQFEDVVTQEVVENDVDGLICGHIHKAGIREIGNILYTNSGDWVESCTALAENKEGRLGVIEWAQNTNYEHMAAKEDYEDMYRDRCLASSN
ncbi:UDP-2,3-diacylglucosamine diphosphatase [Desulfogranum marinum]|uniref:UDP-2,3-diacylglucosamine diphosphatase n=1 Tax=Desulfogranum marinum TaxID=453220 RepID=UPI00196429CA|nr:UDP-2,3-diacylglucosamine diphosphatase [Desulfogranum marinum]MBM9512031.1 UDP-2,3-diacylglucosamine diphosphatase [Desulfogranum marinum]